MDVPAFGPIPHINADEFARLLRVPSKPSSRLSPRVGTVDVRSSPGDGTSIVDTDDSRTVDDFRRWWQQKLPQAAAQDHSRRRKLTRVAIAVVGIALVSSALAPALLKRPPVAVTAETAGTPADISSMSPVGVSAATPIAPEVDAQAVDELAQITDPEPARSEPVQPDRTVIALQVSSAAERQSADGAPDPTAKPEQMNSTAAVDTQNPPLPIGTPAKPERDASEAKALQHLVESVVASATPAEARWVVQLGAPSSEAEAKRDLKRLDIKYRSGLGGSKASLRKILVNGQTAYRLRLAGLSRNEAASLCSRVKGDGGSCSIVR
jgi:cell division protein FtsN